MCAVQHNSILAMGCTSAVPGEQEQPSAGPAWQGQVTKDACFDASVRQLQAFYKTAAGTLNCLHLH
jgi:hypothetical protein